MTSFEVAGINYTRAEAEELRSELIKIRDEALKQGNMELTVKLSHSIGLFRAMIDQIWGSVGGQ